MIWLDNARVIAIFAVIFLHAAAGIVQSAEVASAEWWVANIYDSAVRWCVPVLVMISGALLLDPAKNESLYAFYKKRLSKILIPLVFWSIFFLGWTWLRANMAGHDSSVQDLLSRLIHGKPYYHLWFLFMILPLYLFTPFLRRVVAASSRSELWLFVAAGFFLSAANFAHSFFTPGATYLSGESRLFVNWFLLYIPYFVAGYLVASTQWKPRFFLLLAAVILLSSAIALGCAVVAKAAGLYVGLYVYQYLGVLVIPLSFVVMFLLKLLQRPFLLGESAIKRLSVHTFGIYLVHPVLLEILDYLALGVYAFNPVFSIPLATVVVFLLSLGVVLCMARLPFVRRVV